MDFYQLTQGTPEAVVPLLARATLQAGERLLVVAEDAELRTRIDQALWEQQPEAFLAHGESGSVHAERQPILLSAGCVAENNADYVLIADGTWREKAMNFARVLLLFGEEHLDATRKVWRSLDDVDGAERHFWKQESGKWREGP